jgi:hypothetical protein
MRFTEVKIRKNIQIRPYEHQHVEIAVAIEPGEELAAAINKAEEAVNQALGLDITREEYDAAKKVVERMERNERY